MFNRKHKKSIDMSAYTLGTASTLLVPEGLILEMYENFPMVVTKSDEGYSIDMRGGLRMLLNRYRAFFAMGNLPFGKKPKLTFQKEGLNLQEFKFRPDEADWAELGIIAYGLGVSRCWLFSYMLEMEAKGFEGIYSVRGVKEVVTTPGISRPRQILQISGRRRFFQRILHFRI